MNRNNIFPKLIKVSGIVFCAFIMLFFLLFALLQTSAVKQEISSRLSALLSSHFNQHVVMGKLEGVIPLRVRLKSLSVGDTKGTWLTLEQVKIKWSPLALLHMRIQIEKISASKIKFERLPEHGEKRVTNKHKLRCLTLPENLPPVVIKRLELPAVFLGEPVFGQSIACRIIGSLSETEDKPGLAMILQLRRKDNGPGTCADLKITLHGRPVILSVETKFKEAPGGWVARVLGLKQAGPIQLVLHGEGPLADWRGVMDGSIERYGLFHSEIQLQAEQEIALILNGTYNCTPSILATKLQPLLGHESCFEVSGCFHPGQFLALEKSQIYGNGYNLKLEGKFDFRSKKISSDMALSVEDLSALKSIVVKPLAGKLFLRGKIFGTLPQLHGDLSVHLYKIHLQYVQAKKVEAHLTIDLPGTVTTIFSGLHLKGSGTAKGLSTPDGKPYPETTLSWDVDTDILAKDRELYVNTFRISGQQLHLTLAGRINLTDLIGSTFNSTIDVKDLGPVTRFLGQETHGAALLRFNFSGNSKTHSASGSLEAELTQVESLPQVKRGRQHRTVLQHDNKRLHLATGFSLEKQRLTLSNMNLDAPGGKGKGNLIIYRQQPALQGNLEVNFRNLSELGQLLHKPLRGSVKLRSLFTTNKTGGNATLSLIGKGLETPYGNAMAIAFSSKLKNVFKAPRGDMVLNLSGLKRHGLTVSALAFRASGDEKRFNFIGNIKGKTSQHFHLQTRGTFSHFKEANFIQVATLKGAYGPFPLKLLRPFTVEIYTLCLERKTPFGVVTECLDQPCWFTLQRSSLGISTDRLSLALGSGQLEASGRFENNKITVEADFKKLALDAVTIFKDLELQGYINGSLKLSGPLSKPRAFANARFTDLRLPEPELKTLSPANLNTEARLEKGQMEITVESKKFFQKPLLASLKIPVQFSMYPFVFKVPPEGALEGKLKAHGNLSMLTTLLSLQEQTVSGNVDTQLDVYGTLREPRVKGLVNIQKGSYENFSNGTVIKDLVGKIVAERDRLKVTNMRATDGEKGNIVLNGHVDLNAPKRFPFSLDLAISNATLFRREDITAQTNGDLKLYGSLKKMILSGKLKVVPAEIHIPKRLDSRIPDLNVIEINQKGERIIRRKRLESGSPSKFFLDIRVELPNRVYVRGRGVNSEWQGDLRIKGTVQKPLITGEMNTVRGYFDVLGKRFDITNGTLLFSGISPPVPVVNITAESSAKSITGRLRITGNIINPEIRMESDPPLPQDEIMARLLFGRELSKINPLQALKLARALRILSGSPADGGALDFLGRTRDFLGLNRLEIQRDSTDSSKTRTSLGIGKYLTEDVYMDVEKGLGDKTGKVSVKVEVTPNISIESEVGTDTGSDIGVNWKNDY